MRDTMGTGLYCPAQRRTDRDKAVDHGMIQAQNGHRRLRGACRKPAIWQPDHHNAMGPGFRHARTSELAALGALHARLPGYHAVTTAPCATSSPEPCAEPVAWKSALMAPAPVEAQGGQQQ